MGNLRFRVPSADQLDQLVWDTAYITGMEGIPWACETRIEGDQFIISRAIDESGKVHIVWPTRCLGNVLLTTTSLRLAEQPYGLVLELARGVISKLRNQTFEWQKIGLKLSKEFLEISEAALSSFLIAATSGTDEVLQDVSSQDAIDKGVEACVILSNIFSSQALEIRSQSEGRFSTLLGTAIPPELSLASIADAVKTAFNLISVGVDLAAVESSSGRREFESFDRQIEWARGNNIRVCCGPLVNFRKGALPRWMVLLDEGFERVLNATCQHVEETVERYRGRVHLWNCASALNVPGELAWNDEQVLRFAVTLIETVRRADQRCPVLLTIDQPWSEYLRERDDAISPLHFADALIRADLGLSGLALELNMNAWPDGSLPRDPLEIGLLVDRWALLGLPLMIILTCPSSTGPDPRVLHQRQPVTTWKSPHPVGPAYPTAESLLRMLLAKQSIHGIIWNQASDQIPHPFPHAGLWDSLGKPKPTLLQAAKLRQQYLY